MQSSFWKQWMPWMPGLAAAAALVGLTTWLMIGPGKPLSLRVPGTDLPPGAGANGAHTNAILAGKLIPGSGQPAELPGAWPRFRGPDGNGISPETQRLIRNWDGAGPRELWGVDVGEGYAGAAVRDGRVYVMDYDRANKQDALRCLSLADGREIWRFAYPVRVKRNHGMSRTVPTITEKYVVGLGPKCHVICLDKVTGELKWGLDLVRQYGAKVPPWYAGQCPLVETNRVILAPGGDDALMIAVELATGKELWKTPNPNGWKMTHSSIVPITVAGQRMYVYCANKGVVGVSATDGTLLWETTDWKISIATVPSPLPLEDGRLFFSGGYNAGSLMMQVKQTGDAFAAEPLFRLDAEVFGATQQTPIYFQNHIFGVRPDSQFVCLDTRGNVVWTSGSEHRYGLGPFLKAEAGFYVMNDSGRLDLVEASTSRFNLLAQAQVLHGRESWGPMALAGGRLIVRDITRMVCLDVAAK